MGDRERQAGASAGRISAPDERALIARAQKGCERSARALIEAHKDRLYGFVGRIIRDHHDSEEICQEAFLRAFDKLDTFSAEFRFSTWLFTIAYRLCLNQLRRKTVYTGDLDLSIFAAHQPEVDDVAAATEEAAQLKTRVWEAVDELSAPQQAAVILFYREGQGCDEIGKVLGIPTATVKSHLHRARARLKQKLSPLAADDWRQERRPSASA